MWRGGLLPPGCAAAPKRTLESYWWNAVFEKGPASQASGSKLPPHKSWIATTTQRLHSGHH
ncbi:hypothetical protein C1X64_17600 [Pseudomonas sp. GW456-E7]|nr:hypothetical protein C1X64_17600 [Pseudomonas sp. GW456-E7]